MREVNYIYAITCTTGPGMFHVVVLVIRDFKIHYGEALVRRSWMRCPGESTSRSSPKFQARFLLTCFRYNLSTTKSNGGQVRKRPT